MDDPFLDDYDLLAEGLLSEADARRMYERGEITQAQLADYLKAHREVQEQPQKNNLPSWITVLIILGLLMTCLYVYSHLI
jgi:hypothetical protein